MLDNIFIFIVSMFLVIKGAAMATKYAARLAEAFNLSKYVIGFIIVAVISVLPEALISINSAIKNVPSFGLGVLFGTTTTNLTLIFALIILFAKRGIKVESKILKNHYTYLLILVLPLIFGLNGHYSRLEGLVLIIVGGVFYYMIFKNSGETSVLPQNNQENHLIKTSLYLLWSMAVLLIGAHFVVVSATELAILLKINSIIIGMLIVGVGAALPELFFSLKAVKKGDDELAIGDILGTVLTDVTIVIGIIALINPFLFPVKIIYTTGLFMFGAAITALHFMRSGQVISKKEGFYLFLYWIVYILVGFFVNK